MVERGKGEGGGGGRQRESGKRRGEARGREDRREEWDGGL